MLYANYGVSSQKKDVHEALQNVDKGLFPTAFCKIIPDILSDENYCSIMHADGSGTKSLIAYMMWRETQEIKHFSGISQDALVMNIDDILCVGIPQKIYLSTTIGRNAKEITKEALKVIIESFEELCVYFQAKFGVFIQTTGGETADLGDIIRTLVVDATLFCRIPRKHIVDIGCVHTGQIIVGLSSFGLTNYERIYNSGISSNGLTLARHALLNTHYSHTFPNSVDTHSKSNYIGPYKLTDPLNGTPLTIGEALLSPTRTYTPIITELLSTSPHLVNGIIHCTGGGQTKNLHFGKGLRYVKNDMFEIPPIFVEIQKEGKISYKEMYQVFNMGHRMEIIGPEEVLSEVLKICNKYNLEAKKIGIVERSKRDDGGNEVLISSPVGELYYS